MHTNLSKLLFKLVGAYQVLKDSPEYIRFENHEAYCRKLRSPTKIESTSTTSLDLGCGENIKNPFEADFVFGVDIFTSLNSNVLAADLSIEKIPFESEHFDFVTAHDFIEHVPRVAHISSQTIFPFVSLMSEIYRVLKPNGFFLSVTPAFPFSIAFTDPTHTNFINEHTFRNYFSGQLIAKIYGFNGKFEVVRQGWRGRYLITILRKI